MRGNAMSGAPIISGTNQLPKPPIIAGITMKKIMIRPCAVTNTLNSCGLGKNWMPGFCSSRRMAIDSRPPITPAIDREHQVHRADVLVVRRIDETPPSGRMMLVSVVGVVAPRAVIARHRYCPSTLVVVARCIFACATFRAAAATAVGRAVVAGIFLLRLIEPGCVILLADDVHHDRHEGVILAAQFRALAVICAFALGLEPGLVDAAREWRRS